MNVKIMLKNNKHNHFIPSPFPVVTEYENTLIKEWNGNTVKAIAEVLKYTAQATATMIKEK